MKMKSTGILPPGRAAAPIIDRGMTTPLQESSREEKELPIHLLSYIIHQLENEFRRETEWKIEAKN